MGLGILFKSSSLYNKLSFIFSIVAMVSGWISFVMPAWGFDDNTSNANGYGLWRLCDNSAVAPVCVDLTGWNLSWYGTTQSFAVLGFIGINLGFLLIGLQIFVERCRGEKEIAFWNFIWCIVTGVCYLVAVGVFGIMFDDTFRANTSAHRTFGYSFGLALVAVVFHGIVVAILQLLEGIGAVKK